MDEYNKYAALANTIKIEDITSCETKQSILKRIKKNDTDFTSLWICNKSQVVDEFDYDFDGAEELAWLGYYLGQSTNVEQLYVCCSPPASYHSGVEVFRRGIGHNKSIQKIHFGGRFSFGGSVLPMMDTFIKHNKNLSEIELGELEFIGAEDARQLSLALGGCNKSLKIFSMYDSDLEDGHLVDIITALSMHPQLTELRLSDVYIGRNECMALSTLLRWTTNKLQKLMLYNDDIDDERVEVLTDVLTNVNTLQELNLGSNRSITIHGWKKVATLLEMPDSKLETLNIYNNNIGDEGSLVFANVLANNSTLECLDLGRNSITNDGWAPFSKLLCDTSSVNKTYLSNHTLEHVGINEGSIMPGGAIASLGTNTSEDKQLVAITKILQNHYHFNMEPFFEWEFKVLPLMISWFARAAACAAEYKGKIEKMKLSTVYDFIREFPMLYVEASTREEIKKHTALEMQLQRAQLRLQREQMQLASQLEEVQQCKARAMRRL